MRWLPAGPIRLLWTGLVPFFASLPALTQEIREDLSPDPARYRGLHGSAILSRYPIRNVRVFRYGLS
jgi:hypothetical protein